jgi:ubiquinone/menaquinone biosynthesis C-methylase UbiE
MFESAYTRLEFDTTLHFLSKYLPKDGSILDAGCGPGRYAIELARRGYMLALQDIALKNLEFAKRKLKRLGLLAQANRFVEGSIEDLSAFPDESFDAVLCLGGPLSHIMNRRGRMKAVSELVRVAKARGPIFIAVINKFSMLQYELTGKYLLKAPDGGNLFRKILVDGDHTGKYVFTAFHGFLPEELRDMASLTGIEILEMVGLEGLGAHHERDVNRLARDKKLWGLWLEAHYATCNHPAVQAMSEHCMLIGRRH